MILDNIFICEFDYFTTNRLQHFTIEPKNVIVIKGS